MYIDFLEVQVLDYASLIKVSCLKCSFNLYANYQDLLILVVRINWNSVCLVSRWTTVMFQKLHSVASAKHGESAWFWHIHCDTKHRLSTWHIFHLVRKFQLIKIWLDKYTSFFRLEKYFERPHSFFASLYFRGRLWIWRWRTVSTWWRGRW
jgi:hypothetical protein